MYDEKDREIAQLKAELAFIKEGIRHCDPLMTVDGNDMFDCGWTTTAIVNHNLHKMGLHPFSWVGFESSTYNSFGEKQ